MKEKINYEYILCDFYKLTNFKDGVYILSYIDPSKELPKLVTTHAFLLTKDYCRLSLQTIDNLIATECIILLEINNILVKISKSNKSEATVFVEVV